MFQCTLVADLIWSAILCYCIFYIYNIHRVLFTPNNIFRYSWKPRRKWKKDNTQKNAIKRNISLRINSILTKSLVTFRYGEKNYVMFLYINEELSVLCTFFYLLLGYPKANFGPLAWRQPYSPDVNHHAISSSTWRLRGGS